MKNFDLNVTRLAGGFSTRIHEILGEETCKEIDLVNSERQGDSCATQDHLDANVEMHTAFVDTFGREPDFKSDGDTRLWNAAWNAAVTKGFGQAKLEREYQESERIKDEQERDTLPATMPWSPAHWPKKPSTIVKEQRGAYHAAPVKGSKGQWQVVDKQGNTVRSGFVTADSATKEAELRNSAALDAALVKAHEEMDRQGFPKSTGRDIDEGTPVEPDPFPSHGIPDDSFKGQTVSASYRVRLDLTVDEVRAIEDALAFASDLGLDENSAPAFTPDVVKSIQSKIRRKGGQS